MNYEETKQILTILKTNYPQSFKTFTYEQATAFLKLWSKAFEKVPVELVVKAVEQIIFYDPREFAPNIGAVNCKIKDMLTVDSEVETVRVWEELMKQLPRIGRENLTEEKIQEISPLLLKCYSLGDLKNLAIMDYSSINFERSRFMKDFKKIQDTMNNDAMRSNNLMLVASKEKLKALGLSDCLKIEMEKENEK